MYDIHRYEGAFSKIELVQKDNQDNLLRATQNSEEDELDMRADDRMENA